MKQRSIDFKIVVELCRKGIIYVGILSITIYMNCSFFGTKEEGWKTYRHDNARSGITDEPVSSKLSLRWMFKPSHEPNPAWSEPAEELKRSHFDNVYHVTVADGKLYFGSSVDNKVYAIDVEFGETEWIFFSEGPVRYAPTIWKDRIYFGSDDGYVYCLKSKNGKLLWKYRAGPSNEKVLGNGRMISLWPVRTSVLVDNDVIYFGAGVFPYEGIYICALNADDGSVIWKNDTIGDRAHELEYNGISPQSYLVSSENVLYVPSGRAMPAAFDKENGRFLYYCSPPERFGGGSWAMLDKDRLIAGVDFAGTPIKVTYNEKTGKKEDDVYALFPGIDVVVTPDISFILTETGIYAVDIVEHSVIKSKLDTLKKEKRKMDSIVFDLRRKLREKNSINYDKLNKQKDDIEKRINDISQEEKRLITSLYKWKYLNKNLNSLILAGKIIFAGGNEIVIGVDSKTGRELWRTEVKGSAHGLAASNGSLFVSTEKGNIYCFGKENISQPNETKQPIKSSPYPEDKLSIIYETAAEKIVKETGIEKGYCLVLDAGTGRLAFELAKKTELKIVGIEEDAKKVEYAKKLLDAAGLYGSRIVIENWDLSGLPDYFANLIVSDKIVISGEIKHSSAEVFRVLRPYGGITYLSQPSEASNSFNSLDLQNIDDQFETSEIPELLVTSEESGWIKITRGKLEGAGSWTQQEGNPQNTGSSDDKLVKGPLGVLWFGKPGPKGMMDRHAKAMSPVSINGRLFIQGEEIIMAYDAYNGTLLWEREIPGAVRGYADYDGGNLSVTDNGLYVAAYDKCYRLDPATGITIQNYEIPLSTKGKKRRWGYLSCTNGILYGSTAEPLRGNYAELWNALVDNERWKKKDEITERYKNEYEKYSSEYSAPDDKARAQFQRRGYLWHNMVDFASRHSGEFTLERAVTKNLKVSDKIFALDPGTGKLLWEYNGKKIANITISIGDGKIFFAENAITKGERKRAIEYRKELIKKDIYEEGEEANLGDDDIDVRTVVALDAGTGEKIWGKPVDLTGCCGDKMWSVYHDGMLFFYGNFGNGWWWTFQEGSLKWRRIMALSTENGDVSWSRPLNYRTRPLIVGDKIIIEPRACDFRTGKILTRIHPITGKQVPWEFLRPGHACGITSASAHALFYRSFSTGFYDIAADNGVTLFGAIRPSCLNNIIPANGLLLYPEGSSGCNCSLPLRCSVALKRKTKRTQPWTVFISHGAVTPVKHFAINLGAPSDMKDYNGTVWFGYPGPKNVYVYHQNVFHNYGIKFDLHDKTLEGMGYFCKDFKGVTIQGTDKPWLFTSGCIGLLQCEVPLIDDVWGEEPGIYTVRLGFNALPGDYIGQRVFDIKLQDKLLLENFDILKEVSISGKAVVKEFKGINVTNGLKIEISAEEANSTIEKAPIINFIEVIREDTINITETPGLLKSITMSNAKNLLRAAEKEFQNGSHDEALDKYHEVLDAAPSEKLKQNALEGMAAIGSPKSLSRIAMYCRDNSPILWDYKEPSLKLLNSAMQVFIAIANNISKNDKQKAIKMLEYAWTIANTDIRKEIVFSLKKLGIGTNEVMKK